MCPEASGLGPRSFVRKTASKVPLTGLSRSQRRSHLATRRKCYHSAATPSFPRKPSQPHSVDWLLPSSATSIPDSCLSFHGVGGVVASRMSRDVWPADRPGVCLSKIDCRTSTSPPLGAQRASELWVTMITEESRSSAESLEKQFNWSQSSIGCQVFRILSADCPLMFPNGAGLLVGI